MPTTSVFLDIEEAFDTTCHLGLLYTWCDNKVCEPIAVKVLHTSWLNITVVAFKILPLGSYAPMPVHSPRFKRILELVLWNVLQSCCRITPDVIKMPSFQYFLYLLEEKKVMGARSGEWVGCFSTVICLRATNFLTDSALIQAPKF
jgi:hypothetical protein